MLRAFVRSCAEAEMASAKSRNRAAEKRVIAAPWVEKHCDWTGAGMSIAPAESAETTVAA